jgi:hypothetical protein
MRSESLTARKVLAASDVTVGAEGVADASVILNFSLLVLAELGEYELADFRFRVLSKRRLKASDVFILCWEVADIFATGITEVTKRTAGLTFGIAKIASHCSLCAKEL